jgi:hypothetical protein
MSGNATLTGASVDQAAGPITIAVAANIGITLLLHRTFDVLPAASTPVGARVQQRKEITKVNRVAPNQTLLAHSALPFTHTDRGSRNLFAPSTAKSTTLAISALHHSARHLLPHKAPLLIATAVKRAIATRESGPKPIGDTAHTLTRRCC